MTDILVSLVRDNIVIDQILRPLRSLDGKPAITYHKKLWPIHEGIVYLDGSPPHSLKVCNRAVEGCEIFTPAPQNTTAALEPAPTLTVGWDPSQHAVISASGNARLIVDAGPGTGKTAVACARLASLIEQGSIEPVNCLIVSFTQTAVLEIRHRIKGYLSDPSEAAGIKVATLDAYAWSLRSGFDESASLKGDYEEGVAAALQLITENSDATEYLERVEHVIIDEAQDIIGVRAAFVVALVRKLAPDCGVTVFADDAQAIYGFAEDTKQATLGAELEDSSVLQRLRTLPGFKLMSLTEVHRTSSPELREIFTRVRGMVLAPTGSPTQRSADVRAAIERITGEPTLRAPTLNITELPEASLVLFRRRAEALMASAQLKDVPHRLRLGGMPNCLPPWIAACFFDFTEPRLGQADFEALWNARVADVLPGSGNMADAWTKLSELAGLPGQTIDIKILRRKLGRRQPPSTLCSQDFGSAGPVLGTIHGSKGREAETVLLLLPPNSDIHGNTDEEMRIAFVGATRARTQLRTGSGFKLSSANLPDSKRTYSFLPRCTEPALMTEIGRDGDIWASGLTGYEHFNEAGAVWAQQRCLELAATPGIGHASRSQATKNLYAIAVEDEAPLAILSPVVRNDLWLLAAVIKSSDKLYPSTRINYLRLIGARTLVLAPDDQETASLHEPWATSGFMLAPMVLAYTKIRFWKKK
ncbi:UvrD-helicase domain-containing protein [Pseudomonas frederiksbergensis]|uniref:UvrD-helicase domain-containing protein n=1 Tax=Pseudomonas frederiksbergensis TaxID=104087 RepID=UPI003D20105B